MKALLSEVLSCSIFSHVQGNPPQRVRLIARHSYSYYKISQLQKNIDYPRNFLLQNENIIIEVNPVLVSLTTKVPLPISNTLTFTQQTFSVRIDLNKHKFIIYLGTCCTHGLGIAPSKTDGSGCASEEDVSAKIRGFLQSLRGRFEFLLVFSIYSLLRGFRLCLNFLGAV